MKPAKALLKGHAPGVKIGPAKPVEIEVSTEQVKEIMGITPEKEVYLKAWEVDAYRNTSPGEAQVDRFLEALDTEPGKTVIDAGCGTGRGGYRLWLDGFDVTLMDFAWNCLDPKVSNAVDATDRLKFVEHDLTEKSALRADYVFCCDVLEHLPPESVDDAIDTMLEMGTDCFFSIATTPDHFGKHPDINEPLHKSVHGYQWWLKKFVSHGVRIHRSLEQPGNVIFFVSGFTGFTFDKLQMNTGAGLVHNHIETNSKRGYTQLPVGEENPDQKVIILGGGPSLGEHIEEIKAHKAAGAKIITINGTYAWAKEHDLWPVTQFMIDARPFNARFVDPVDDQNMYIIASQCHPKLLEKLPRERTFVMQCNLDSDSTAILNEHVGEMYKDWFPIPGGSSAMLRALPALQMLGYRDVELYGFDSCLMGGSHHAYEQRENELGTSNHEIKLETDGKEFVCHPWMLSQAKEFMEVKEKLLKMMNIEVHGDGLIAHLIEHDSKLED